MEKHHKRISKTSYSFRVYLAMLFGYGKLIKDEEHDISYIKINNNPLDLLLRVWFSLPAILLLLIQSIASTLLIVVLIFGGNISWVFEELKDTIEIIKSEYATGPILGV